MCETFRREHMSPSVLCSKQSFYFRVFFEQCFLKVIEMYAYLTRRLIDEKLIESRELFFFFLMLLYNCAHCYILLIVHYVVEKSSLIR